MSSFNHKSPSMYSRVWHSLFDKLSNFEIKRGITSFINPHSLMLLQDEAFAESIDHWHVDGISLIPFINGFYKKEVKRFSFDDTSLAPIVFDFVKRRKLKVAIVGTKSSIIRQAVRNIERKYGLSIDLYRHGYFETSAENHRFQKKIMNSSIDVVVCGMGTPFQEEFLINLKDKGWRGYGFTCGGYLHQIAKRPNYYPKWMDDLNLRWVYRIYSEPKLFKRYLVNYARFFWKFFTSLSQEPSFNIPVQRRSVLRATAVVNSD